jgi:hypothetical protein
MSKSLADPKAIGEDIERLVIDAVDGLRAADDSEDWYDAVCETAIGPRRQPHLLFGSICLLGAGASVEIKACKRRVSNGADRDRPGRWALQVDQHERLLAADAAYLLVVYSGGVAREIEAMLVVPASIIDEVVRDSWYEVDRHEREVCQLPWPHVLGDLGGGPGAE